MLESINIENLENAFKCALQTNNINIKPIINQWVENKQKIFNFFGSKLVLEEEISVDLSDNTIINKVDEFCDNSYNISTYEIREMLRSRFSPEEIKTNKISDKNDKYLKSKFDKKIYNSDMKLSKFLSRICEDNYREKFNIEFSKLINNFKFKGILCVSIDPIDYLTMSNNLSNWKSCHRFGGEYQGGMLSYMTDKVTAICYVKSKNDEEYTWNENRDDVVKKATKNSNYKFTANNKKWRMCCFIDVDNKQAVLSRQYPFTEDEIAKKVREILRKQFDLKDNTTYDWTVNKNKNTIKKYIKDNKYPLHYNDILWYNYEIPYSMINIKDKEKQVIFIGNSPICPKCGTMFNYKRHYALTCRKCR